jgi:hypothetical protein
MATKLVRSALYAGAALLAISGALAVTTAYSDKTAIDTANITLDTDRMALANDKGILLKEKDIRREMALVNARTGSHAKRTLLDKAHSLHGIQVTDFALDGTGTQFQLKLVGTYDDIIAATVSLPANAPGVSMASLRIDADATDGPNRATATLTGAFSS